MNRLLTFLYRKTPSRVLKKFGKSNNVRGIRNLLLRGRDSFRETVVTISRNYLSYKVKFLFYASIKVAAKAKEKGIETKLLNNSIRFLEKNNKIEDNLTVFDIGANFGYLSLVWATTIAKNGNIFSFEPNREVFTTFLKSVEKNKLSERIQVENLAVGKENGEVDLFLNESSSNIVSNNNMIKASKIAITSIDNYMKENQLDRCDLIKLDVDGIEYDILLGAKETIRKFKPILIVETNNDMRILNLIEKLDYTIFDMELQPYKNIGDIPCNIFCKPKN